jgi:hypothetical protein
MSLRVNLILVEEQRSGSKLNLKSFLRIISIVAPALVALLIGQQALSGFMLRSELDILESQWSAIQPKQRQAVRLASRLNYNRKTKDELDGWAAAKPSWTRFFTAVMGAVPAAIQLTSMRVSLVESTEETPTPTPKPASPPERTYRITLDGKTHDVNSMLMVQTLEKNILTHPEMTGLIESVNVANFAADTESSNVWSRVFTIECRLVPLPAKEKR